MSINVRLIKDWSYPDLLRQTPGNRGVWGEFAFDFDHSSPDIIAVLNRVTTREEVSCLRGCCWAFIQEPPVPQYRHLSEQAFSFDYFSTQDTTCMSPSAVFSHGSLPWHIDKSYDELKKLSPFPKKKALSWVTSNKTNRKGHKLRMAFLDKLKSGVQFDLYGRGFIPVDDKWDALAPYSYTIAFENCSTPHYWTEKIMDAYLAWCMPIYYGAPNIDAYFPPESFVWIDPKDKHILLKIKEIVASDHYIKNLDAIDEARRRILDEYQLFPRIAKLYSQLPIGKERIQRTFEPIPDYRISLNQMSLQERILRRLKRSIYGMLSRT